MCGCVLGDHKAETCDQPLQLIKNGGKVDKQEMRAKLSAFTLFILFCLLSVCLFFIYLITRWRLTLVLFLIDQADRVPVVGEAELLARTLFLSADLDWRRREKQGPEDIRLEKLFFPLLDVLHRLSTSVYLPLCKTDKSLQLMLRLLLLLGKNLETERENGVCSVCR